MLEALAQLTQSREKTMKKLATALVMSWAIIVTSQIAYAACRVDMGKDWRKVGAGRTVKFVCTGSSCGGTGHYVVVRQFKYNKASGAGALAALKRYGKKSASPISGFSGLNSQGNLGEAYRIFEIYYNKSNRKSDRVIIESISSTRATAQANFSKAKSTIRCS